MSSNFHFSVEDDEAEFKGDGAFDKSTGQERELKVRLNKWLWAARFFKTSALARTAIEKGKVFYNNERVKPTIEIKLGDKIHLIYRNFEKTVVVKKLSTRRKSIEESQELYEELSYTENNASMGYTSNKFQADTRKPKQVARFLRRALNKKAGEYNDMHEYSRNREEEIC